MNVPVWENRFCVYNYEEENNISQKGENSDQLIIQIYSVTCIKNYKNKTLG